MILRRIVYVYSVRDERRSCGAGFAQFAVHLALLQAATFKAELSFASTSCCKHVVVVWSK